MDWMEFLGWEEEDLDDLRLLGYSYIQQGIYPIALTYFEALHAINPRQTYDLHTIGALHLQMGNGMKSLDFLDRALQLEPHSLDVRLNRAKALFMLGYRRQGLMQVTELENCEDPKIAAAAAALILAYK